MIRSAVLPWIVLLVLAGSRSDNPRTLVRGEDSAAATVASSERAEIAWDAFDAYIAKGMEDWQVPGMAVAVVHKDKVVFSKGYGVRELGGDAPVDTATVFAIASNTKAFTAALLAMAVDEGKLAWDDPVEKYLPWLELQDPLASQDLRVRDLLCHRSGLGTFSGDLLWYGTPYSPEEILRRAKHLKPAGLFRAHYGYSNLMFLAAGEVVRVVHGMPWTDAVRTRILEPLEMRRAVTSVRDLVTLGNVATPHKTMLEGSQPIPWMNWDGMAAAGGIIASVDDITRWLRLQLGKGEIPGGPRLFSANASREMWQAQIAIPVSAGASQRFPSLHFSAYGLGWSLSDYQGRKLVAHGGGYDGMFSQVMLVPEEDFGIVVLSNSMTSLPDSIVFRAVDTLLGCEPRDWSQENLARFKKARQDFRSRIDRAITPVAPGTQPSHEPAAYAGTFRDPLYGDVTITAESKGLVLRCEPNPQLIADLSHLHYDTYVIHWREPSAWFDEGTAHFVADAKGVFTRLQLDVPNDDLWFHELDLRRVPSSP